MINSFRKIMFGLSLLSFTVAVFGSQSEFSEESNKLSDLRWQKNVIPVSFSRSLLKPNPAIKKDSDVSGALERSLAAWEAVANIEFKVTWTDKQTISPSGVSGDGISLITIAQTPENLLVFANDGSENSALSRVFYNRRGLITEADIVINPYQQFSTDGTFGTFDLESTITHEIGHLLGIKHSPVFAATMFETQTKNGIYNLASFSPRTLSEDDISAVRGLYGSKYADENCCGMIGGKILLPNGKPAKQILIWAEDLLTGRIFTATNTDLEGVFEIKGLPVGKFKILGQGLVGEIHSNDNFVSDQLGEVEIIQGKNAEFDKQFVEFASQLDVNYIGFNGQISKNPVILNSNKTYSVYFGGKNLDFDEIKVKTNSPYLSTNTNNLIKYDYGINLGVWSFEVNVNGEIPDGDYSLLFENDKGQKTYLVGEITVEQFSNPWVLYDLK